MKAKLNYTPTGPVHALPHPNICGGWMVQEVVPPQGPATGLRRVVKTYTGRGAEARARKLAAHLNEKTS